MRVTMENEGSALEPLEGLEEFKIQSPEMKRIIKSPIINDPVIQDFCGIRGDEVEKRNIEEARWKTVIAKSSRMTDLLKDLNRRQNELIALVKKDQQIREKNRQAMIRLFYIAAILLIIFSLTKMLFG